MLTVVGSFQSSHGGKHMKLTAKRINELVGRLVGPESIPVVNIIKDNDNVSEFLVAKKIKEDIQVTRNILYRLHNHDLVAYKRVKDRKKGWYIGYWTFNKRRAKELYHEMTKSEIERYNDRLREELASLNNFYLCRNMCVRMNFEKAAAVEFTCPECGTILDHQNNERTIETLKVKINEIRSAHGQV